MNYKRVIALTAAFCLILISGCKKQNAVVSKSKDELQGKLIVWSSKDKLDALKLSADNFKKIHAGVTVDIEEISSGDMIKKLSQPVAENTNNPDILCVKDEDVQSILKELPDVFASTGDYIKKENYLKYKIDNLIREGKVYGIPLNSEPGIMIYRSDILQAAGINAEYLKTWQDFASAGKEVVSKTGKPMIALSLGNDDVFREFLNQVGASYFDKDGNPALDSEEALKAAQELKNLYNSTSVYNAVNPSEIVKLIKEGKIASAIVSPEEVNLILRNMPELKGTIQVMKVPAFEEGGNQAITLGGYNLMLLSQSKNKNLAAEFSKYISEDKENIISLMNNMGIFPAYSYYYDEVWFNTKEDYFSGLKLHRLYSNLAKDIYGFNYSENYSKVTEPVAVSISNIILKGQDIKATMDNLQKQIELNNK